LGFADGGAGSCKEAVQIYVFMIQNCLDLIEVFIRLEQMNFDKGESKVGREVR
jgi:hypothetical protein